MLALIDTGATRSLITHDFYMNLAKSEEIKGRNFFLSTEETNLRTADGGRLRDLGSAEVSVQFAGRMMTHNFIVVEDLSISTPILLGLDFLIKNNVSVTMDPLEIKIGSDKAKIVYLQSVDGEAVNIITNTPFRTYELPTSPPPRCPQDNPVLEEIYVPIQNKEFRCRVMEIVALEKKSTGTIWIETRLGKNHPAKLNGLFTPAVGTVGVKVLCPSLVEVERNSKGNRGRFVVTFVNNTNEMIEIKKGIIGHWEEVAMRKTQGGNVNLVEVTQKQAKEALEGPDRQREYDRLIDIEFPDQNSVENLTLKRLLAKHNKVFSLEGDPYSHTPKFSHKIRVDSEEPVFIRSYPVPIKYQESVREQILKMLEFGVIEPTHSSYNSPLVPVIKKSGEVRLCLDFRALNKKIHVDRYPLPNIDEILAQLGKSKFFTSLDLRSGYWQIPLEPESREKTAFIAAGGHYHFKVLPFGLVDAPAAFQRIVNETLKQEIGSICHCYLDDIVVMGKTFEEHINNVERVVEKLGEANLTIRTDKSKFCHESLDFLGHVVTKEGIRPQPQKIECIQKMGQPVTVRDVLSFLGLCGYYRRYIADYSKIAAPLHQLTGGKRGTSRKNDKTKIVWNEEAEMAFTTLKTKLTSDIVLSYPNYQMRHR